MDRNGTVSFAEAHAYAVIASNTIDIPLRTSDVLLKTYSRLAGDIADTTTRPQDTESTAPASEVAATEDLPLIATPEIVQRYHAILAVENSSL